jgi:hypothetical protein
MCTLVALALDVLDSEHVVMWVARADVRVGRDGGVTLAAGSMPSNAAGTRRPPQQHVGKPRSIAARETRTMYPHSRSHSNLRSRVVAAVPTGRPDFAISDI